MSFGTTVKITVKPGKSIAKPGFVLTKDKFGDTIPQAVSASIVPVNGPIIMRDIPEWERIIREDFCKSIGITDKKYFSGVVTDTGITDLSLCSKEEQSSVNGSNGVSLYYHGQHPWESSMTLKTPSAIKAMSIALNCTGTDGIEWDNVDEVRVERI